MDSSPLGERHPWVSSPRLPSYDLPQRLGAMGDSTATNPTEKQSPRANGIGSVPTTHIPARLEGPLGGKRGNNEAKLFCVSKCQSSARCRWQGLAQLLCRGHAVGKPSALSAAGADACAHPARRQVTCIFHSLGFITSWNADLARRAMRGFASLRVYFRCRVFFCQVRSAAKLVRGSRDVWLWFGRLDGNRAPSSAAVAARRSPCSPLQAPEPCHCFLGADICG